MELQPVTDATERSGLALRASEQFLFELLERSGDATMVLTPDLRVRKPGARAIALLGGTDPEDLTGRSLLSLLSSDSASRLVELERELEDHGGFGPVELVFAPRDGRHVPLRVTGAALLEPGGPVHSVFLLGREPSHAATAAPSPRSESAWRDDVGVAIGELAMGIAHEFRNPLFGVSVTLDALEARIGHLEDYRRHLDAMRQQLRTFDRLINSLLEFAQPREMVFVPELPAALLEEAVRAVTQRASQADVGISCEVREHLPRVAADRACIVHALGHLLDNAIQHSPAGQPVRVRLRLADDDRRWVIWEIEDSGPGFATEVLANLFKPFYSHRPGGAGLGLCFVRRFVEQHGGRVNVANLPRRGARVTLALPVAAS